MVHVLVYAYLIAFAIIGSSSSAKILAVVPTPNYSHQMFFHPIWRELSLRGHQVTVLTTDPVQDPALTNLTEIDLSFSYKLWRKGIMSIMNQKFALLTLKMMTAVNNEIVEQQLDHPQVQNLLNNPNEHFDLLMMEYQIFSILGFSHRFKCPYIAMLSYPGNNYLVGSTGNPAHPIMNSDLYGGRPEDLTFYQRLESATTLMLGHLFAELLYLSGARRIVKKYFGEDSPTLEQLMSNMDLFFMNTDQILHTVRPVVPGMIELGGGFLHRRESKPLPQELQKLLDDSKNGFIYFSLGTNVQNADFTPEVINKILATFSGLPYTILWKSELENLTNNPENVLIAKWFPQQEVLEHRNIKLFIMQGGLQSMEEAIYYHVPMIGIPFFSDQPKNVKNLVARGGGLSMSISKFTTAEFKSKITEVIENPKYRENIEKLAALALDQPMASLEKAVWWTEYVLRNKGAKHFRSPLLDIPFYQYYLLDVIGFVLLVGSILTYLVFRIGKMLLMACISKKKVE